jgi:predicted aminopeptidase
MSRLRFLTFRLTYSRLIVLATVGLLLCACGSLRYYGQAVRGQSALLMHRRSLPRVLQDPTTDSRLAARLRLAQQARRFASSHLGLPDNRSYTSYVELKRPYVVWNVFAAPRYSVDALAQCFPIAGCVAYRGWFAQKDAQANAAQLRSQGNDVWVGGVPAYSTLGWFADPILSSMLSWDDDELDSTIFHELAHQLIYVKDDTAFNESFATFVQDEGLREWRSSRGLPTQEDRAEAMDDGFTQLVLDLRTRLKKLYASGASEPAMASGKQREIEAFRVRYAHWRSHLWSNDHRYDAWVAQPINNARLLPFGLYDQWTPAFGLLFQRAGKQWPAFYDSVRKVAALSATQRDQRLRALLAETGPTKASSNR